MLICTSKFTVVGHQIRIRMRTMSIRSIETRMRAYHDVEAPLFDHRPRPRVAGHNIYIRAVPLHSHRHTKADAQPHDDTSVHTRTPRTDGLASSVIENRHHVRQVHRLEHICDSVAEPYAENGPKCENCGILAYHVESSVREVERVAP